MSAVDAYEFSALQKEQLTAVEISGLPDSGGVTPPPAGSLVNGGTIVEYKPHFYEWATVQPGEFTCKHQALCVTQYTDQNHAFSTSGMICLARKKKTAVFRQYVAAETAVPVVACAACIPKSDEKNYFFAGVARSKSVRTPDDGIGPNVDEFFTVSIGGMATLLNTSGGPIYPGDLVEWSLTSSDIVGPADNNAFKPSLRAKQNPRRIAIAVASVSSPKIIGRALSFAKKGETLDIL